MVHEGLTPSGKDVELLVPCPCVSRVWYDGVNTAGGDCTECSLHLALTRAAPTRTRSW
jgi:hypothetical protein